MALAQRLDTALMEKNEMILTIKALQARAQAMEERLRVSESGGSVEASDDAPVHTEVRAIRLNVCVLQT